MQTDDFERERRRKAVAEVLACQVLDGVRPSSSHLAEMQRYADGLVSLDELLTELIECIWQCSSGEADCFQEGRL
ncbi:hypothetical protein [Pseudomonas sp. B7]|uniref:antitoxin VbhA family protein n=1 Tax=Pseudomonas sp. B7 TaxID=360962 RepID=UPI00191DDA3C|nr:hypothetical protein [Pseudomonas sp. B7]